MSNRLDVLQLIAEVEKRPILWDSQWIQHRGRGGLNIPWQEVAQAVGVEVEQCKRKWKNLRDAYRAEIRRVERRRERSRLLGDYDPNADYESKWLYFEPMSFIDHGKRRRYMEPHENSQDDGNTSSLDNECYAVGFKKLHEIKHEPQAMLDDDVVSIDDDDDNDYVDDVDDVDTANDKLFKQFQTIATPQAARRLSATLTMTNPILPITNEQNQNSTPHNSCKCNNKQDDQVHFLEDLEREERKLIKSTRQDITRSQGACHVGDGDYNFLVSFLPQMKKMSEYQNLQFRARMCDMVLSIMTPTSTPCLFSGNNSPIPPVGMKVTPPAICSDNVCGTSQEDQSRLEGADYMASSTTSTPSL